MTPQPVRRQPLPATGLDREIDVEYGPEARVQLEALGRTEDVRFSPTGRRLALAVFERHELAVAEVEIDASPAGPAVAVTAVRRFRSSALRLPHGLDWLDEDTLVVGNREGGVVSFRLPARGPASRVEAIEPLVQSPESSEGPGSVLARRTVSGEAEVLRCNNWADTVTRHRVVDGAVREVGEVVARRSLDLPDGLALSHDGRWLAVSSHNSRTVFVYDFERAGAEADPVAVLRGVHYPHGLRFGPSGRSLLVADAGGPFVHVFSLPSGSCSGAHYPAATIRVMSDETYSLGATGPGEGGPKGIDVDRAGDVLAVTAGRVPLGFFSLRDLSRDESQEREDVLLGYELDVLAEARAWRAAADESRSRLAELHEHYARLHGELELRVADVERLDRERLALRAEYESSRSWRMTRPLRLVASILRAAS